MKLCSHPLLALTLLVQLALAPSLWAGPASHVGRPDAPGVDVDQATSTLRFGPRFQDRMVVQRGVALRVDGRAIPGREVEARFDGEVATTRADGDGLWGVSFAPRGPSLEPLTLVATCEGQRVAVDDVLVGDVWVFAGSTDLCAPVSASAALAPTLPEHVRFYVPLPRARFGDVVWSADERRGVAESLLAGRWWSQGTGLPSNLSAIAWQFARALEAEQQVPIGVLQLAVGPATLESWLPRPALLTDERLAARLVGWWASDAVASDVRARARRNLAGLLDRTPTPPDAGVHPYQPGFLWAASRERLRSVAVAGMVFGCSAEALEEPERHAHLLRTVVETWREHVIGRRPVLLIESSGQDWFLDPDGSLAALRRDAERRIVAGTGALVDLGLVVTHDLTARGLELPARQRAVGERLAVWAFDLVHERVGCVPSGPMPTAMTADPKARTARVAFDYADGLATLDGAAPRGLTVLGPDGRVFAARGRIEEGELVVEHPEVSLPTELRYGFGGWGGNLVNRAGLPAPTFRLTLAAHRVVDASAPVSR